MRTLDGVHGAEPLTDKPSIKCTFELSSMYVYLATRDLESVSNHAHLVHQNMFLSGKSASVSLLNRRPGGIPQCAASRTPVRYTTQP